MFDHALQFLLTQPRRVIQLGTAVTYLGSAALLAGAIGQVFLVAHAFAARSAVSPGHQSLATIFPSLPTWWIPESSWAAGAYVLLAIFGILLTAEGRKFQRLINLY